MPDASDAPKGKGEAAKAGTKYLSSGTAAIQFRVYGASVRVNEQLLMPDASDVPKGRSRSPGWRQVRVFWLVPIHPSSSRHTPSSALFQTHTPSQRPPELLKHKATSPPPPYDSYYSMDSMALSSTRPPTSPSTPPPRLSINRLMALYPRERLQVHPLRWSDRQLDLIGCRIHGHDETAHGAGTHESTVTTQTTEATSCRPDPYTRFLADRLSRSFDGHGSLLADTVLNLIWPIEGQTLVNLNQSRALYFAQQPRASLPFCRVSVSVPGPDPEIISLACVDYHDTLHMRQKYFRPSSRSYKTDFPAWWRSGILYARHIPKKPEKDPVLVALIVALAQHEHRQAAVQPPPPDSSFTVRVLVFGDGWPKPIHVYVACVQARFLDKLDFPSREPAVDSGLDIDHWRIAAEPFQTLPYRVSRVLRPGHYQGTHTGSLGEAWGRAREKRKQEGDGTLDEHGSATKKKKR